MHRTFKLLQRSCALLVAACLFHLSVMIVFYMRSFTAVHIKAPAVSRHESSARSSRVAVMETTHNPRTVRQHTVNYCPEISPHLEGPRDVVFLNPVNLKRLMKDPRVSLGGHYMPRECVSRHRVALIIPFRDREQHLKYWLSYMLPFLQRQQLDYGIYVIEQAGNETFNRAKLLNVGYVEALKEYDYNCFILSDVDLIPMDDRNIYKCYSQPRHLSVAIDKFDFMLPYDQYFGGVSALSKEQFLRINGLPNNYWGWGGEDDDIYNRVKLRGMSISRPTHKIGMFKMIRHERDKLNPPNPQRFWQIAKTSKTMQEDGINSLSYSIESWEKNRLYTRIIVDIGAPDVLMAPVTPDL